MMEHAAIELEEKVEEKVEQQLVVPKNVLTQAGLKKLPTKHKTPKGEKLRAYELILNKDRFFNFGIRITCGPPQLVQKPSAAQQNAQKIEDIRTALELEQKEKGRVIEPDINLENLRDENYVLVKQGKSLRIITREDYSKIIKYGRFKTAWNTLEGTYDGEYTGDHHTRFNGKGTFDFFDSGSTATLKGSWRDDYLYNMDTSSEYKSITCGFSFVGRFSFETYYDKEDDLITQKRFHQGRFTDKKGNYYEGEYRGYYRGGYGWRDLPEGKGKFFINEDSFEGNVTTIGIDQKISGIHQQYVCTVTADNQNADGVFYLNGSSEIHHMPQATPSFGIAFRPVLTRALKLSQYINSWRQTMVFVFNNTPYIMERSYKDGTQRLSGSRYYIEPPGDISSGQYASFHHRSRRGASKGFFSYQLNCPRSPLQVRCGFATQVFGNNRFGGELIAPFPTGETSNGATHKGILWNEVEQKAHDVVLMVKDNFSGIAMKLGMNNDHTSFFYVMLYAYNPDIILRLNIPEKKEDAERLLISELNEDKESEHSNFFLSEKSNQRQSILAQLNEANDGHDHQELKSYSYDPDQPMPHDLSSEYSAQNDDQGHFYGTSARGYFKQHKTQGTSTRKDLSKQGLFLYQGTGGYNRFVQDYPCYFNYNVDHKYLERAIASAESVLEIGAGIALMYFSCGALCFVGEELLSCGISSLWYTCRSGSDFNWESFLINKGVGLAFGALYQGCCIPCEVASYFMIANRKAFKEGVRKAVSVVIKSMSDTVKSDLVYVGDGLKAETYLKSFCDNAALGAGALLAESFIKL